jgi:DNA-binding MarR family transcriptional regulator
MVNRFESFVSAISCISRYIQKIERDVMVRYGLKGPHAQYLIAMNRFPEGVTAAQLSSICERDKAAVSRAIAELETAQLVQRPSAVASGYRALLTLTERGKVAAAQLIRTAELAVEQAGHGLTEENRAAFYAAFHQISTNLQHMSEAGLKAE